MNTSAGGLGTSRGLKNTIPRLVPALEGFFIEDIAVGSEHTLALTNEGQVWAWGSNRDGQLGLGHYHYMIEPEVIRTLADKNIKQVADLFKISTNRFICVFPFSIN